MKKIILFTMMVFATTKVVIAQWQHTNFNSYSQVVSLISDSSRIFAGTGGMGTVFLSTDNGNNWTAVNNGLVYATDSYYNVLAIKDTFVFACSGSYYGLFFTTNNGQLWTHINSSSGLPSSGGVLAIDGNNIFAGTVNGVFLSTDNGSNWTALNTAITAIRAFAINGNNIFAGTNNGSVFLSTDNCNNWTAVNNGLTASYIKAIKISGNNIYAGTDGNGVFLSTNNGGSWTPVNTGLPDHHIANLVTYGDNIFAGIGSPFLLGYGVYLSTDSGTHWSDWSAGLPTYVQVFSFTIKGTDIYAGTESHGIWKRSLLDLNGVNELIDNIDFSIYPNPAKDYATINFSKNGITNITIYNIFGTEVYYHNMHNSKGANSETINVSGWAKGMYIVKASTAEGIKTSKLLVE